MSSRRFVLFLYICIIASMFFACSPAKPMETAPTNSNIPAKLDENQNSIGLKLVTPVDSSGVGAGNEIGYYDLLYRGMGANILYTDYATKQCVYLSSQVSSTHQDETDLIWIPSVDGGIEPFLSGDKLYMRVIGMPGDSDGSGTPGKIMEMNLDGSERRDLFTLQSGETFTQNAIASNGTYFFCLINRVQAGDAIWNKSLIKIDAKTGQSETIYDFDLPVYIVGAFDDILVLKTIEIPSLEELFNSETSSQTIASQVHTLYTFAINTSSLQQVKKWKQIELSGACQDNTFCYLNFEDLSVYRLDISTGDTQKVCDGFPACDPEHTNLLGFFDSHLQFEVMDLSNIQPDGSGVERYQYAVDLDKGEIMAQTLFIQESEDTMPSVYHIMAETEDYFLVHYATTTKVVESIVSDGTIGTEQISLAKNALIKKSDYWSNINNIIPISDENL